MMKVVNPIRFGIFIAITTTLIGGLIGFAIKPTVATVLEGQITQAYQDNLGEFQELKNDSMLPLKNISGHFSEVYTVTAYCSCEKCCGEWAKDRQGGIVIGAWGKELTPEYSVASPLPFGTKVHIEGLGIYEVLDRTSTWVADKYNGRIIDIYMGDDHEAAVEFGKQVREVTIID